MITYQELRVLESVLHFNILKRPIISNYMDVYQFGKAQ